MKSLPITSMENALVGLEELRYVYMMNDPMNGDVRRFPRTPRSEEHCFFVAGTTVPNRASASPHIERKCRCKSFRSQYDASNFRILLSAMRSSYGMTGSPFFSPQFPSNSPQLSI